jgi:hypothetical protein
MAAHWELKYILALWPINGVIRIYLNKLIIEI